MRNTNIDNKIASWLAEQKPSERVVEKLKPEIDLYKQLEGLAERGSELSSKLNRLVEVIDIDAGKRQFPRVRVEVINKGE